MDQKLSPVEAETRNGTDEHAAVEENCDKADEPDLTANDVLSAVTQQSQQNNKNGRNNNNNKKKKNAKGKLDAQTNEEVGGGDVKA